MSGKECSEENPQIISVSSRGSKRSARLACKASIPVPGLKQKSPQELGYPWVDRWTRSNQAAGSKFSYLLGLFFLLLPVGLVFSPGDGVSSFLVVGPFFGIVILGSQLNTSGKLHIYGPALLKLGTIPEVGGTSSGAIRFLRPLRGCEFVEIKLACYEKDARKKSDYSYSDAEYWSIKQQVRIRPEGQETIVEFSFDLPTGLPIDEPFSYYWRLEVRGTSRCKSMYRSWRMPVKNFTGAKVV
ncbi:hypothetical protein [Marinobacter nauticus]|uniref:hypothetical protein n=1 Tax=Marinobacter nauticus TaxID=2743 RepID=UPI004043F652